MSYKHKRALRKASINKKPSVSKKDKEFEDLINFCKKQARKNRKDPTINKRWVDDYKQLLNTEKKNVSPTSEIITSNVGKQTIWNTEWQKKYSDEMQVREEAALKEARKKAKRVGIPYNKGGYEYISEGTDLTKIGKK